MAGSLGYISAHDGFTIIGSGQVERSTVGDTRIVLVKIMSLHNGTLLNLDGTSDSATMPGPFVQLVGVRTGGVSYYASAIAKKGHRGTTTKTKYGGGSETCTSVLEDVKIVKIHTPSANSIDVLFSFRPETSWA